VAAFALSGGHVLAHSIAGDEVVPFPPATAAARLANLADTAPSASPEPDSFLGEHEASPRWLSHGPLQLPGMSELDADESVHPFATASRMLMRKPDRQVAPGTTTAARGSSVPNPAGLLPADDDVPANLNNLQQAVTELIVETTGARMGPGGRISFSLAGIEGFHYSARDGHVSIGHEDLSLTVVDTKGDRRPPVAQEPTAPAIAAGHDASPAVYVIQLLREVLAYPLVWVLAFLLLAGKIALLVANRRARKRRHRRRPISRQQEAPQRIRQRVRIRVRRRQPAVGLQQPR